jgi:hypothetical protein
VFRQAWWVELVIVEYLELLLFRGTARSLVWWPKVSCLRARRYHSIHPQIKAILFIALYSVWEHEQTRSGEVNYYVSVLLSQRAYADQYRARYS